jgi:phosphoserine phosphatase
METAKTIVFMDTDNTVLDEKYAERCRAELRKQLGWKVEVGTRSYDDITKFSMGYSRKNRDVTEVIMIFRMANGLM